VFAIDPFAGRVSVYDPNINIYVTQQLPNFGFRGGGAIVDTEHTEPVEWDRRWRCSVGGYRSYRSIRGGVMFSW
jgi:hypothetical protein